MKPKIIKDISEIQAEIDQIQDDLYNSQAIPHAQPSSIQSLPTGAIDGVATNPEIKGLSLVNSVVNGDFSDGTTWWASLNSTSSVLSNVLSNISDGTALYSSIKGANSKFNISDKIFSYCKVRVLNTLATKLIHFVYDGSSVYPISSKTITNPIENQWYEFANIGAYPASGVNGITFWIRHEYPDATTANGKVMEVDGNAGIHIINMTAIGIEDYTEAQMLDLVRNGYIDGLQNVENSVVETVGKNLFDKTTIDSGYKLNVVTGALVSDATKATSDYIKVKENTDYIRSNSTSSHGNIVFYDASKNLLVVGGGALKTSPPNAVYAKFDYLLASVDVNTYLLEEDRGQVLGIYEPYQSSKLTANVPLRRVQNEVTDRVFVQDNEVWLEKNVEEYVLQSGDITSLMTTLTNLDAISVPRTTFTNIFPQAATTQPKIIISGFLKRMETFQDSADFAYSFIDSSAYSGGIYLYVPKGTYANLAAAQADLAGTKVHYQLATPQLINLTEQGLVDGELMSYVNGTCYNSSDTFHSPDISFDVPINTGAVISGLVESAEYQAKAIDSKASKVQEDWIEPTLLNGWVNFDTGVRYTTVGYYKDDFGRVQLKGSLKDGVITAGTKIFDLPVGYRPAKEHLFIVGSLNTFAIIAIDESGGCYVNYATASRIILNGISFRAEVQI